MAFEGIKGAPETEFSEDFVQAMANRMAVSYHKYGPLAEAYPDKVDAIKSLYIRIDLYLNGGITKNGKVPPGNTEYLVDAANFAMIEFMRPRIPGAKFVPTDAGGSPGRVMNNGAQTTEGHGVRQHSDRVRDFYKKDGD